MLRWGGVVVWFRATDAGTVLVFASPGYRDPFARPTVLTADEADQWAAIAEQLAAAPPTVGAPGPAQVAPSSDTARVVLGGGDLVLASGSGTTSAALSVRIGATRADGLTAMVFPDAAPGAAANLRDAARSARRLHATAAAAAAAAAIPAPAPATAVAAATSALPDSVRHSPAATARPASASHSAAIAPAPASPSQVATVTSASAPVASAPPAAPLGVAVVAPAPTPPNPVAAPATSASPPVAVVPHAVAVASVPQRTAPPHVAAAVHHEAVPSAPAMVPATNPVAAPVTTVSAPATPVAPAAPVVAAAAAPQHHATVHPRPAVPSTPPAIVPDSAPPSVVAASVRTSTPPLLSRVSVTAAPPTAAARTAGTTAASASHRPASGSPAAPGVSDATVNNLVHQWQPELMYCYTEFGVRTHPDLTGQVAVRVVLSADGVVGHAAIEHHIWSGEGAAAVESCIRSRVVAWRFPPAAVGSAHVFKVEFAP